MKTCHYCKVEKPLADFSKNKQSPDGLQHRCKSCFKTWNNSYKETDHYKARNKLRTAEFQAFVDNMKMAPCTDCGNTFPPECMDFDHLPEHEKSFGLGNATTRSRTAILEEVAKCELVCSNCHRIRTKKRRATV